MTDQPNSQDQGLEELQRKVEDLRRQVEAREAVERARLAKPEAQASASPPGGMGDQTALKKLVADKSYDAHTQAKSILGHQPPAVGEAAMDARAEKGAEAGKEREFWPMWRGKEG